MIQILPGPFPFADSAEAVIAARPSAQQADLRAKLARGPYSNRVVRITGTARFTAWDRDTSTDSAMVHVMLLSRTRRPSDFALMCWTCTANPRDELQLQITPAPGQPAFAAAGGVLFVNWGHSTGHTLPTHMR